VDGSLRRTDTIFKCAVLPTGTQCCGRYKILQIQPRAFTSVQCCNHFHAKTAHVLITRPYLD